ncbi:MAG: hypothetical protein K2Y12_03455 [Chitinophagaceae bacterium]|nr:hypothetical protein [Chitinophagaceae bacterium]
MTKTNSKEPFQEWDEYLKMAERWRGKVIKHAIDVEQVIELFIARHYVIALTDKDYDEQIESFRQTFFWQTEMTFSNKIKIVCQLVKLQEPYFLAHTPNSSVGEELTKIMECRNVMAHWQLDFSHKYRWFGAANKEMQLNKLNKFAKKPVNIYSEASIDEIISLCLKYTTLFLHWSHYPIQELLPEIYKATKKRIENLTPEQRKLFGVE